MFRASSLGDAILIYQGLCNISIGGFVLEFENNTRMVIETIVILLFGLGLQFFETRLGILEFYKSHFNPLLRGISVGFIVCLAIMLRGTSAPFIYFQF